MEVTERWDVPCFTIKYCSISDMKIIGQGFHSTLNFQLYYPYSNLHKEI